RHDAALLEPDTELSAESGISPFTSHQLRYATYKSFHVVYVDGRQSQRSWRKRPTASMSARYRLIASVTSEGRPRPSVCHARQPSIAHWSMPCCSAPSLPSSSLSGFAMRTWKG